MTLLVGPMIVNHSHISIYDWIQLQNQLIAYFTSTSIMNKNIFCLYTDSKDIPNLNDIDSAESMDMISRPVTLIMNKIATYTKQLDSKSSSLPRNSRMKR